MVLYVLCATSPILMLDSFEESEVKCIVGHCVRDRMHVCFGVAQTRLALVCACHSTVVSNE